MKRMVAVLVTGLLMTALSTHNALAFGVKDVVSMSKDGIPDSLIVEKIRHSGTTFHLNAKDLRGLEQEGVSNDVIAEMLRTEDSNNVRTVNYDGYPWWPYGPPWYLDVDFGFYAPFHRAYAPVYVRHEFVGHPFVRGAFRRR